MWARVRAGRAVRLPHAHRTRRGRAARGLPFAATRVSRLDLFKFLRKARGVPGTDVETLLRGSGLRVTRPRLAVLEALRDHPHADTESVIARVRDDLGRVSHQAVYDVLRALTDAGLLRRIQPAGSVARYEVRVGDNHHHLVCRTCGVITDVECAVGEAPCLTAADDHGFVIDQAEVVYWGTCPECAAARIS